MEPAPVWLVVIGVFHLFEKVISLPIKFSKNDKIFYASKPSDKKWYKFNMAPFRVGRICVLAFIFRIKYKLLQKILSSQSENSETLYSFGAEAVCMYLIGLLICLEAVFSMWTVAYRLDCLVDILNLLLARNKARSVHYVEPRISLGGYVCLDTGEAVATVASLGFLGFPAIAALAPLVMDHDPSSHIALWLMTLVNTKTNVWVRRIIAGMIQGSVAAFGAAVCLQVLLVFILIIIGFHEMLTRGMSEDGTGVKFKWVGNKKVEVPSKIFTLPKRKIGFATIGKAVTNIIERESALFRPSLMVHRRLTILCNIARDGLIVYSPGIISVGMLLVIITVFFFIKFSLPIAVAIPTLTIAVGIIFIMIGMIPVTEKMDLASQGFQKFWKIRLNSRLAKLYLKSCRHCVIIPIGVFASYRKGSLLRIGDVILVQITTLLINIK